MVSLTDYGAFVELAPNVRGMVHVSEMADRRIPHPREVVSVGDQGIGESDPLAVALREGFDHPLADRAGAGTPGRETDVGGGHPAFCRPL